MHQNYGKIGIMEKKMEATTGIILHGAYMG